MIQLGHHRGVSPVGFYLAIGVFGQVSEFPFLGVGSMHFVPCISMEEGQAHQIIIDYWLSVGGSLKNGEELGSNLALILAQIQIEIEQEENLDLDLLQVLHGNAWNKGKWLKGISLVLKQFFSQDEAHRSKPTLREGYLYRRLLLILKLWQDSFHTSLAAWFSVWASMANL